MKNLKIFISILIIVIINNNLFAQEQGFNKSTKKTFIGLQYGLGFIQPNDINSYLTDYYNGKGFDIDMTTKAWPVLLNTEIHLAYFLKPKIEIKGALNLALAFTSIEDVDMIGMSNDRVNMYTKIAPQLGLNMHKFLTEMKSFYYGGGLAINSLSLNINDREIIKAITPGIKLNIGLLDRYKSKPIFYELEVNIVKTGDLELGNFSGKMSYSGFKVNIGVKL